MAQQRLVVLVSGSGTNLQAILDACAHGRLPAQVVAVISNRTQALALERARKVGVPAVALTKDAAPTRELYDEKLAALVHSYSPDWVVLAGWLRILTRVFLEQFAGKVVNLHPALPGTYPGLHAIERAWEAAKRGETRGTGVMVHRVVDEGVDDGPVLASEPVPILPEDTLDALEARIHEVEHRLLVETLQRLCTAHG